MADVESLELQITGDAKGAKKSLDALIDTLGKLKQATAGGCGLSAVAKGLKQVNNSGKGVSTSNTKSAKSFANLATKVTAAALTLKKGGAMVASWIKESNDYIENVNLFTVAMGEYADSAKQYAEEVGEIMGIDPSDWMRNQGVFMTLASGFGVATDRAATMSQQLTQLGYDISSFYNTSVEEAMQKLQSGISGELEPLRRLGYDLSQAKLEATALSLGIDKTVSSMTQAEKAELRYYAIMTQVTTAQGDMARTLQDPANQLRVLEAQLKQAARALGDLFLPALNAILPYAIAAVKVIRLLANTIGELFGVESSESDGSGLESISAGATSASSAIDEATGSAKKLKKSLLGIDELNVMSDPTGGAGSSGAGAVGGGGFDFELPTYDFISDATVSRVNEIVTKMKEWLGISDEITSWSDLLNTNFGKILIAVGAIGTGIAGWKIFTIFQGIGEVFSKLGITQFIDDVGFAIAAVFSGAGTVGEAITYVFSGSTGIISGVILGITALIGYVSNFISILNEGGTLSNMLGIVLSGLAIAGAAFLIAIGVGATIATAGWAALIAGIIATVGVVVALIISYWEEIKAAIGTAWTWLYDTVLSPIFEWFAGVATWFYNNVITPIVNFFTPIVVAMIALIVKIYTKIKEIVSGVIVAVGSIFSKIWEIASKIIEIAVALGIAFYTYVLAPIISWVVSAATWIYDKLVKPVLDFLAMIGKWAYDKIISPLLDGLIWLRDKAIAIYTAVSTAAVEFISGMLKSVINSVLYLIERNINNFIRLLNAAIGIINAIPGVSITKVSLLSIPRLADGGMVSEGQMFVAREAGPELVGNVGRKTAVMNNDQIVDSVTRGVYQAVLQAMGQSGGTQVVEAKVNDKVLFEVVVDRNRREIMRTGASPLLGGV